MSSNIRLKGRGVNRIITSKVMLSPLAGVTDNIFRRLVRKWAPNSLLFTEMINATSLKKGFGTQKINQIDLEEGPIGVQIFDNRPYAISEAAKQAEDAGAFLIDINMGCPVKKIANKGGVSSTSPVDPKSKIKILIPETKTISKVISLFFELRRII